MPPALAGLTEHTLCLALSRSAYRNAAATVVCDGRPKPLAPSASPVDSVTLLYAGLSRSADDLIISLINAHSTPRRITLVTNDNAIKKAAKRRKCKTLSSEAFIDRLAVTLASPAAIPHPSKKPDLSPVPASQVAGWLEEFGFTPGQLPPELQNDPLYRELLALSHKSVSSGEQAGDEKSQSGPKRKSMGKTKSTANHKAADTSNVSGGDGACEGSGGAVRKAKPLKLPTSKSKITRQKSTGKRKPNKSPFKTLRPDNILSADVEEQLKKFWPPPGL